VRVCGIDMRQTRIAPGRDDLQELGFKLFSECVLAMRIERGENIWETWQVMNHAIVARTMQDLEGGIVDHRIVHRCVEIYQPAEENKPAKLLQASDDLDDRMIASIGSFYRERAIGWMDESTVGTYCRLVGRSLTEAEGCFLAIFPKPKADMFVTVLEKELIAAKLDDLLRHPTGVRYMLRNARLSELSDVYCIISRIDEAARAVEESSWISHLESNLNGLESSSEEWFRPTAFPH